MSAVLILFVSRKVVRTCQDPEKFRRREAKWKSETKISKHPCFEHLQQVAQLRILCVLPSLECKYYYYYYFPFQVPESGDYTFYVSCYAECELWLNTQDAAHHVTNKTNQDVFGDSPTNQKIVTLMKEQSTAHNQWNK